MNSRSDKGRWKMQSITVVAVILCKLVSTRAESGKARPDNSWDIAVIDRALATVKPGQDVVVFGDFGLKPDHLRAFRERLLAEQEGVEPEAVTPPTPPFGPAFTWPSGIVNYQFDPAQVSSGAINAAKMQAFRDGVAEWAAFANLTFTEFTGTPPTNYITVQDDSSRNGGFSNSIGMLGGPQLIQIGSTSWNRGTICHEVGHSLGLYHEQQRSDRDTYVTILSANIIPGTEGNFTKLPNPPGGSTNVGAYDFYSIMHYERNALSVDPPNKDTIAMQSGYGQYLNIIGRVGDRILSKLDRAGMAAIYGPPALAPSATVINRNDGGPGSLRTALYFSFDKSTDPVPTPTSIVFNITGAPVGNVFTIKPSYPLVAPGANTTIDGNTQTVFSGDTNPSGPEVVIDGSTIGTQNLFNFGAGFILRETGCTIKNLVINGFKQQGIIFDGTTAAINGTSPSGNTVSGCYIGTDATGAVGIGNGSTWPGIELFGGAHNNTIGGLTSAARNVISGSTGHGVVIQGAGTNNNLIVGNYFGTNAAGTGALSNTYTGVAIFGGAQNNTIGGLTSGARNVLSGNKRQGFIFADAGTNGNVAFGNYIGLNAAGTAAIANGNENFATHSFYPGCAIFNGAQNNIVGGTAPGSANVISGNTAQGVIIADNGTDGNLVQGNFIGLNPAGTSAIRNGYADPSLAFPGPFFYGGVSIFGGAKNNIIGGTSAGAANVISGNTAQGVAISGSGTTGNLVQGNFLGTNPAGTAAIGNGFADVPNNYRYAGAEFFSGAQSNTIGGTGGAALNLISGNAAAGVAISSPGTSANSVQGNYIGTNKTGTAAIANGFEGVSIFNGASANTIGGTIPGAGNVISGNSIRGVGFSDAATTGNFVQGNLIGLNAAGSGAIANAASGVECYLASNNTIGGTSPGARNYISGNSQRGVLIDGANATGNLIQGNTIGLTKSGTALPNGSVGVSMFTGAHGNTVGGSAAGASNLIASNTNEGVAFFDSTTITNTISRNSIYSNHVRGIGIYTSSNNNQAAPLLSSSTLSTAANPNGTDVSGTLNSTANTTFTIEFFASPGGTDEGKNFIGSTSVTTNGSGSATFASVHLTAAVPIAPVQPGGSVITATATAPNPTTGPNGDTSQFSSPVSVTAADSDGDGIPDNWMMAHFGHPTGQVGDKSLSGNDADGDGLTNLQEFLAGTDPLLATSALRITSITHSGNDLSLSFNSIGGKTYRIESKDDLSAATWTLVEDQILATGTSTPITDSGAGILPHRFYRVALEP